MGCIFKNVSDDQFVTNEYTVREPFENIAVRTVTADVTFVPTEEPETKVVCREDAGVKHLVAVQDDTLIIDGRETRKWYQHINFRGKKSKITIYVPKGEYKTLTVDNTTGDIQIPQGLTFADADLSVTTGDLSLGASVTGTLRCSSTTGDVDLTGIRCGTLISTGTTGDLKMNDVIAEGKMTVRRVTGHVEFHACDAAELSVKNTTGHVKGTLLSDKTFEAKATTGKVDVPKSRPGGLCEVITTTGYIDIDIQS